MDTGTPALLALTCSQPVGHAVVHLGWPLPSFRGQGPCLLAIHQGAGYDYTAFHKIARETGQKMPMRSKHRIGVIGVGRWDGARLVDLVPIERVFAKGQPGLWRLDPVAEQTVRERYAEVLAKKPAPAFEVLTMRPDFPWGDC